MTNTQPHTSKLHELAYDATNQCIQCGYCLPSCPTYISMGQESASPRGRINLVKAAAEGKIDVTKDLAEPIDLCLGCRACETACPVNVPYAHILESAKEVITENEQEAGKTAKIKRLTLQHVFTNSNLMRMGGNFIWLYQVTGVQKVAAKMGLLDKFSPAMAALEHVMPTVERPGKRPTRGTWLRAYGTTTATVSFFTGCISDAVMNKTNRRSVELLRTVGCDVYIPKTQNCCGALHSHQGDHKTAVTLAKENIEAFEEVQTDYIVNNAGGCGASLQEYEHLLTNEDSNWQKRARLFSARNKDISEILVDCSPLPFKKNGPAVVTYQPSCHLTNVQKVTEAPRQLLKQIPGTQFVEMGQSDTCCASGGIYNLLHHEEANKILDHKMDFARATKAQVMIMSNPGCLLQMRLGIKRAGLDEEMEGMHLVDLLAELCDIP
ncbi:(Fe-S)-binding protein [Salsuginibacillus kocurii]|uniref:(Fe-S)-binding protein n=1 Tax=Salsuginibacillus kocurii TaxID=427078 RepID=UPI000368F0AE|nr:(Fe-S)-binding protein [Salsuginibacillus kocurii]